MRAGERDAGNYAGHPADPVVTRPAATAEVARPGETISELFEQYAKENPKNVKAAGLEQARRDIGTFVELVGRDFPVSGVNKKAAREWKALLQAYPVKATETAIFKGKSFKEIIAANARLETPKPVIVAKTVNRYISGFSAFCHWLVAHDYIEVNPFADMFIRIDKTKTNAKPFEPEHLKALFASPLFTGCQSDAKWHVPGGHLIRDHRYCVVGVVRDVQLRLECVECGHFENSISGKSCAMGPPPVPTGSGKLATTPESVDATISGLRSVAR